MKPGEYEIRETPSGMFVSVAPNIGKSGWRVKVFDFAIWKHKLQEFDTETQARTHANLWSI